MFLIGVVNSFAQNSLPKISFAGRSGESAMSWNDFLSAKKEITPIDSTMKIKSFVVSFKILSGADAGYTDLSNVGNKFSQNTVSYIETLYKEKRIDNKILIEQVFAEKNGIEVKLPGMIIKLH